MKIVKSALIALTFIALSHCGGGGGGRTGEVITTDSSQLTQVTQYFGQNGNLWKPEAEPKSSTAGLLVVLLGPEHTGRFDDCRVEKVDGTVEFLDCNDRVEWSHIPYSCVANGGREHWRATFKCEEAAVARAICRNQSEEFTFEAAGVGLGSVCSRHG